MEALIQSLLLPGAAVRINSNEVGVAIEGTVFTVDVGCGLVALKSNTTPSSEASVGHKDNNLILVSLSAVDKVEVVRAAPAGYKSSIPRVEIPDVEERQNRALAAAAVLYAKQGKGVSVLAQVVFDALDKSCGDCVWDGSRIAVMGSVSVDPPYHTANCEKLPGGKVNETALERVKKVVEFVHARREKA